MAGTEKVILFKKEATYGVDAGPTPAANAVLTRNFTSEPVVTDTLERNLDLPSRGRTPTGSTNARSSFSYDLELAGSGTAGTAPAWMEHLECCGMAPPVLTAGEDAEQRFAAAGAALSSGTAHHWTGGERVRPRGSRGGLNIDFTAGAYPFVRLDMMGMLPAPPAAPVDKVAPSGSPVLDRWIDPVEVHTDNTDFTLDGFPLVLKSLTLESGASPRPRNLVGDNSIQLPNHAMTGRIVGDAPDLASKNFYATLKEGAEIPLALVHGTVAGNIVELSAGFLQILKITRQEEDDKLMVDMSVGLNIRAGSDDLVIIAR